MAQNDGMGRRSFLELALVGGAAWSGLAAAGSIVRTIFEPQQQPPVIYGPKAEAAVIDYGVPAQPTQQPLPQRIAQPALHTLDDFYRYPARYQKLVPNLTERDLAALVRVVYNEVGLSEPMPDEAHQTAYVVINRLKQKGYADSITDVVLAPNQFHPVYLRRNVISSFFADLADGSRPNYEVLLKDMLDAHAGKLINSGWKEDEAGARINEYSQQILKACLEVLSGNGPEPMNVEIDGDKYYALYFKNSCMSDPTNVWHNRTPSQVWGSGASDRKFWFLDRIGNTSYYALVPVSYNEPARDLPALC